MDKNGKKDFRGWIRIKEKIHGDEKLRITREGEVWWCAVGENVSVYRVYSKIGEVPNSDLKLICEGLAKLILKNIP